MQKIFHNILVPLTLNRKTGMSMERAMRLAVQLDCHVHFLFNLHAGLFTLDSKRKIEKEKTRVYELKEEFQDRMPGRLKVFFQVRNEKMESQIANYALDHNIDMILLDRSLVAPGLYNDNPDPSLLASMVDRPVLTSNDSSEIQLFSTLVLPVESSVPVNKIRIAIALAKQFDSSIHLVALQTDQVWPALKRVFRLLKTNTELPIVCVSLQGRNLRDAARQYSSSVKGTLIEMTADKYLYSRSLFNRIHLLLGFGKVAVPSITVA